MPIPVKEGIAVLVSNGLTIEEIAEATGLKISLLHKLQRGTHPSELAYRRINNLLDERRAKAMLEQRFAEAQARIGRLEHELRLREELCGELAVLIGNLAKDFPPGVQSNALEAAKAWLAERRRA
jgi:transcriptional regulator with XRE-family HTH domain